MILSVTSGLKDKTMTRSAYHTFLAYVCVCHGPEDHPLHVSSPRISPYDLSSWELIAVLYLHYLLTRHGPRPYNHPLPSGYCPASLSTLVGSTTAFSRRWCVV